MTRAEHILTMLEASQPLHDLAHHLGDSNMARHVQKGAEAAHHGLAVGGDHVAAGLDVLGNATREVAHLASDYHAVTGALALASLGLGAKKLIQKHREQQQRKDWY
jgi:hypothetical protein